MNEQNLAELKNITIENILAKYTETFTKENIDRISEMYSDLVFLSNINLEKIPFWVSDAVETYVKVFLNLFNSNRLLQQNRFEQIWNNMYIQVGNNSGIYYHPTVPTLVSLALASEGGRLTNAEIKKMVHTEVDVGLSEITFEAVKLTDELKKLNEEANSTLTLLKQASGKVAVEKYAEIFQDQSNMHSTPISFGPFKKYFFKITMGKSQWWILAGLTFCISLVLILLNIDTFIKFETPEWNPENLAHLVSRSIIVSLNIFLISFCFKQYRVNKHLHTLNTHRANTLKSFEYLTKAPDKIDPGSYNAILMKVAESIYEAGHTGYINGSDTNNEMPSIIDMTKIITPGKGN